MENKRNVELVVLSDIHLGTSGCQAVELLNYLKSIKPKTLILNGDIIDIWQFKKKFFPKTHLKVIKHLIGLASDRCTVYYITGNHDEMFRKFSGMKIGKLRILNDLKLELDGKRVWFFHGDIFDVVQPKTSNGLGYDLTDSLVKRGVDVKFAIHPVAGRMPGHMNVLLAEANVPYDLLFERDAINDDFSQTDVVVVVGANDVVNPAARHKKSSPLYGMPILDVDKARTVIFLKRSMGAGFAGEENELFYDKKTMMVLGDAKKTLTEVAGMLKKRTGLVH